MTENTTARVNLQIDGVEIKKFDVIGGLVANLKTQLDGNYELTNKGKTLTNTDVITDGALIKASTVMSDGTVKQPFKSEGASVSKIIKALQEIEDDTENEDVQEEVELPEGLMKIEVTKKRVVEGETELMVVSNDYSLLDIVEESGVSLAGVQVQVDGALVLDLSTAVVEGSKITIISK